MMWWVVHLVAKQDHIVEKPCHLNLLDSDNFYTQSIVTIVHALWIGKYNVSAEIFKFSHRPTATTI